MFKYCDHVFELYSATVLHQEADRASWSWICHQWRLDPSEPLYGVVYAKDSDGERYRLITTDANFMTQLDAGPVPDHEWLEIRPGWFVAD
jgi:hypothetical protein